MKSLLDSVWNGMLNFGLSVSNVVNSAELRDVFADSAKEGRDVR